jgi:hypothetical protein
MDPKPYISEAVEIKNRVKEYPVHKLKMGGACSTHGKCKKCI